MLHHIYFVLQFLVYRIYEQKAHYCHLLNMIFENANIVLSKDQILDQLWDCDGNYVDNNTLTVYIRRLRMKVENDPGKPEMIVTVRGMGYKWNVNS